MNSLNKKLKMKLHEFQNILVFGLVSSVCLHFALLTTCTRADMDYVSLVFK